nr:PREDICTED: mucin-2-like [Fopius arisanus]
MELVSSTSGDLEVCCRLPRPTEMPPSMSPIVYPTNPPTMQPTNPPTLPPTVPPTNPPTLPPTIPPTNPPTNPPTVPPTIPPTAPPTMPPTNPPTLPPTQPPTAPPTVPTSPPTFPTNPPTQPTLPPTSPPTLPPFPTFPPDCICAFPYQCDANGILLVSGEGIINPRQTAYPCAASMICCRLPTTSVIFPTPPRIPTPSAPLNRPCTCVKTPQCDANGYIIVSGAGNISPRFPGARQGLITNDCAADEVCCEFPPNGQDSSAGGLFTPSPPTVPTSTTQMPMGSTPPVQYPPLDSRLNVTGDIKNPGTPRECRCVEISTCDPDFIITIDEAGIIDPRFGLCMVSDAVCCRSSGIISNRGGGSEVTGDATSIVNVPNSGQSVVCGTRNSACAPGMCTTSSGNTSFAEFPWMVALLSRETGGDNVFLCGGSMINSRAVLTAAHCVLNRKPGLLVARFGEWNTANNNEPSPFQESDVESVITHPNYYSGGLYHDVAVLILSTPVSYAVNVVPICLPQQAVLFMPGTRCLASGWGRSGFEGKYQTILKKVDLPLVDRQECQSRLRATKLGQYFQLHKSFICAGGEASKDTCTGDGGGPLVCPTSTGQFIQVGIISWGIGCGQSNVPAVYVDVIQHRQWIEQQLVNYGIF